MDEVNETKIHDFLAKELHFHCSKTPTLRVRAEEGNSRRDVLFHGVVEFCFVLKGQTPSIARLEVSSRSKEGDQAFVDLVQRFWPSMDPSALPVDAELISIEFHTEWRALILCEGHEYCSWPKRGS